VPIYEYECDTHHHRFEKWQSMQDEPIKVCQVCGAPVHKVLHPAGIIFKGSGWYITDSRKSSDKSDSESPKAEDKAESKAEAKAEAKSETRSDKPTDTKANKTTAPKED
jgi:putative FmdB family regulatory protein